MKETGFTMLIKINMKDKNIDPAKLSKEDAVEYEMWSKAREEMYGASDGPEIDIAILKVAYENLAKSDSLSTNCFGQKRIYR